MLTGLRLENIALIERLELAFADGFTVLTGETGAGKSILLDALDALLGGAQGSAGARLLRHGAARGRIEASFLSPPRCWTGWRPRVWSRKRRRCCSAATGGCRRSDGAAGIASMGWP